MIKTFSSEKLFENVIRKNIVTVKIIKIYFLDLTIKYLSIKQRYPDTILMFRLGDFYETFDQDAEIASEALNIVLTSRTMGKGIKVPMAGIPSHALEPYLGRLINHGYKVAICEQLSDPSSSKGLVERDVVRVVTPGTIVESSMLDEGVNNFLAAITVKNAEAGLAYIDITTGEYSTTQLPVDRLAEEINRLSPAEIFHMLNKLC